MLIFEEKKLLFVSSPKTGTTAVQEYLRNLEMGAYLQNRLLLQTGAEEKLIHVNEHERSDRLKDLMGEDWDNYTSFVFARNPYDKAVSSYFFYKNGKPITRHDNKRKWFVYLNKLLVTILPFYIWCIIRPLKMNSEYVLDQQDKFIVDYIGKTAQLEEDLRLILEQVGIVSKSSLVKTNTSKREEYHQYFKSGFFKRFFDKKYQKDILLYQKLKQRSAGENLKGISLNEL